MESVLAHIWELATMGAVGVAVFYFQKYNSIMEERVNKMVSRIESVIKSNDAREGKLRDDLHSNMEAMGKATKAINGDMLKIEKSVFGLKKEIDEDIEFLKGKSADINRDFLDLAQKIELAIEAFDERYGKFVRVGEGLKKHESKIYVVEENTGKVHKIAASNRKNILILEDGMKNLMRAIKTLRKQLEGPQDES